MRNFPFKRLMVAALSMLLIRIHGTQAATVVAVSGDTSDSGGGSSLAFDYGADPSTSMLAVGWTSSLSFNGVTISAQIASNNPVGATGEAFLTTKIGGGTTISDQVAATNFVFPAFTGTWTSADQLTLFTGLNLVTGESYFLTIVPDAGFTAGWNFSQNPTVSSDDPDLKTAPASGYYLFSYDPPYTDPDPAPASYAPASAFIVPTGGAHGQIYSVTGNPVPEPSSLASLGVGIGLILSSCRLREVEII